MSQREATLPAGADTGFSQDWLGLLAAQLASTCGWSQAHHRPPRGLSRRQGSGPMRKLPMNGSREERRGNDAQMSTLQRDNFVFYYKYLNMCHHH